MMYLAEVLSASTDTRVSLKLIGLAEENVISTLSSLYVYESTIGSSSSLSHHESGRSVGSVILNDPSTCVYDSVELTELTLIARVHHE